MLYWLIRGIIRVYGLLLFRILYRVKVKGRENIPRRGQVIFAANHCSWLDIQVIWHHCPRRFHPIAGRFLYDIKWLGAVLNATQSIPINGSSKGAVRALEKGEAILIFPAGRCLPRTQALVLHHAHRGVAVLALKSGAPIIPIYLEGTYEAWPVTRPYPHVFRTLGIRFGKPLRFEKMDAEVIPDDILYRTTKKVMAHIRMLSRE